MKSALFLATLFVSTVVTAGPVKVSWPTIKAGGKASVDAKYPSFSGSPVARAASSDIYKSLLGQISSYRKEWGKGNGTDRPSGMYISGAVSLARTDLVSAFADISAYTGGAHGSLYYITYNHGLVKGKVKKLRLQDLFQPGAKARDVVSPLILQELRERQAAWVENGDYRDVSDMVLENFVITPGGLTFIVPPYEAGSWAEGTFWVKVPFKEIVDVLDKNGPLKSILTNRGK